MITPEWAAAALLRDGGFTAVGGAAVPVGSRDGWVIGLPGTEIPVGHEPEVDLIAAALLTLRDSPVIGGWVSPDRGCVIEASVIVDAPRDVAVRIGASLGQDAIFDLRTGETVECAPILVG